MEEKANSTMKAFREEINSLKHKMIEIENVCTLIEKFSEGSIH